MVAKVVQAMEKQSTKAVSFGHEEIKVLSSLPFTPPPLQITLLSGADVHTMTSAVRAVLAMNLDPPIIPVFHYELFMNAARTFDAWRPSIR